MKIILSGGGTLGPVTPLLALRETILSHHPEAQFIWVGTKNGPERELVEKSGVHFYTVSAGKLRRYFSFLNFFDIFRIVAAFFQSLYLIWQEKPDLLISAGGFVSVPLHWAGALLGVPSWIHQQDVVPGLANKLMALVADKITVTFQNSLSSYPSRKTELLGNMARDLGSVPVAEAKRFFNINIDDPVIFVIGGGTGSLVLNQMVMEALPAWPKNWQVIHLVGKERPKELAERAQHVFANYHMFDFFTDEMKYAYAAADVVICRAGMGTLTELAALQKAAILLPKEGHQEDNAKYLENQGAAIVLYEKTDSGLKLAKLTEELIKNDIYRNQLGANIGRVLWVAKLNRIVQIVGVLVAKR